MYMPNHELVSASNLQKENRRCVELPIFVMELDQDLTLFHDFYMRFLGTKVSGGKLWNK